MLKYDYNTLKTIYNKIWLTDPSWAAKTCMKLYIYNDLLFKIYMITNIFYKSRNVYCNLMSKMKIPVFGGNQHRYSVLFQ